MPSYVRAGIRKCARIRALSNNLRRSVGHKKISLDCAMAKNNCQYRYALGNVEESNALHEFIQSPIPQVLSATCRIHKPSNCSKDRRSTTCPIRFG